MKKFIFTVGLALLFVAFQPAVAQTSLTGTSGLTRDTITNAEGTSFKTGKQINNQTDITVKFTKLTGTVAGTVVWEVSNNNTDFAIIATDNLTDASKNFAHTFVRGAETQGSAKFKFLRVTVTTTGTSTAWVEVISHDHN